MVPAIRSRGTPCLAATASYIASKMVAVPLMVNEVDTLSSGIPLKMVSMSASESIATPTLPTSPNDSGASESKPSCVGRSSATDSPVCPLDNRY